MRFDLINATLPDDLIQQIFDHLESKLSRDAAALTCKRWLNLDRLSRHTVRVGASANPDYILTLISRRFLNIRCVFIDERINTAYCCGKRRRGASTSRPRQETGMEASLSDSGLADVGVVFPKLEKLSLTWCSAVTNEGLRLFAERCTSLRSLELQACYLGDDGLAAVGQHCNRLEDLNLRYCEVMTDQGMIQFARGCCKTLKSLGITACPKITDVSLEVIGSVCKSLENLSLDSESIEGKGLVAVAEGCDLLNALKVQCVNITDNAMQAVGNFCASLALLALYGLKNCTDRSLRNISHGCKKLNNLILSDCHLLTDMGLYFITATCTELMHIEVNGCHNINTDGIKYIGRCSRLHELSLLYCPRIEKNVLNEIGKGCKFLQELQLIDCSEIGDASLCGIATGCKNLRKLHMRRCYEVDNDGIIAIGQNCPFLTDLSLKHCDRIRDEAMISISEGCSLTHLNVSGCHQIGDVGIIAIARSSPNLTSLDISVLQTLTDRSMIELGENCPLLKDLVISHCRQITNAGLTHLTQRCTLLEFCQMVYCTGISEAGVTTMMTNCGRIKRVLVEKWKVSERMKRRAGNIINYLCNDLI